MRARVCICVYVCMGVCECARECVYTHVCMRVYVYMCVYTCVHVCVCVYACAYVMCVCALILAWESVCLYVLCHICMYIYVHGVYVHMSMMFVQLCVCVVYVPVCTWCMMYVYVNEVPHFGVSTIVLICMWIIIIINVINLMNNYVQLFWPSGPIHSTVYVKSSLNSRSDPESIECCSGVK